MKKLVFILMAVGTVVANAEDVNFEFLKNELEMSGSGYEVERFTEGKVKISIKSRENVVRSELQNEFSNYTCADY